MTALPSSRTTRAARLALSLAASCATLLGGCAYSPGLVMSPTANKSEASKAPRSALMALVGSPANPAASQTPGQQPNADPAPAGALITITGQLLEQQNAAAAPASSAEVQRLFGQPQPYRIGAGDVLNIVVWDHPEITLPAAGVTGLMSDPSLSSSVGNGYNVGTGGTIQFPHVGRIQLAGLTAEEASDKLTRQLARYLKNPEITLRIQAYRSGRVYLEGELRTPGLQAVNDVPMTLPEAIARAGGFTPSANRSAIAITRNGKTTRVDLPGLIAEGVNPGQILLAAGDMVRVPNREEAKVYVMGEVLRPTALPLRDGRLNLNEALGESGGINPTSGDAKQVYVVRSQGGQKPEIYHLDASTPLAYALAEGFSLKPRDVVYVDPVPLVLWNRVISLILPSAQAVNVTRDAVQR